MKNFCNECFLFYLLKPNVCILYDPTYMRSLESSDSPRQQRLQQVPGLREGQGVSAQGGVSRWKSLQEGAPSGGGGVSALDATGLGTQNGHGPAWVTRILPHTEREQNENPACVTCWSNRERYSSSQPACHLFL